MRRQRAGVALLAACLALAACTTTSDTSTVEAPPGNPLPAQAAVAPAPSASAASRGRRSPVAPSTVAASGLSRSLSDAQWGVRIDAPAGWTARHDFKSDYFGNARWKADAAPDSRGQPLLALRVPGSNDVTDAEVRIGASRAAAELARCTTTPVDARGASDVERINGIEFTTYESGDAAMSHHLDIRAYRVVHDGACYAIDLLVFGTNPQVFDPPATAPFSDQQAFAAMRKVLGSFRFTH